MCTKDFRHHASRSGASHCAQRGMQHHTHWRDTMRSSTRASRKKCAQHFSPTPFLDVGPRSMPLYLTWLHPLWTHINRTAR
eukprot:778618-Amphidinium_carterae.2